MTDRTGMSRGWNVGVRRRWVALAAIVAVAVGGGIAYATVPNSGSGQISVCYPTAGAGAGQLRVIDAQAGQHCKPGEKMLAWQQRGVRYRGTWNSTASYSVDDLAVVAGSAYVAVGPSKNVKPPNAAKWAVFAAAPHPANVVWVAKSGGDFTSVKAALASITGTSAAHRYVIKVEGDYDNVVGLPLALVRRMMAEIRGG